MDRYTKDADELFARYESAEPEQVHKSWRHLLPEQPGLALDVGAGSGRDAAWLRQLDWEVIAVEPSNALRQLAESKHGSAIHWLDDRLPQLNATHALGQEYRLILVSAVFMHLPPSQQERAFRKLSDLLAPGGLLIISLPCNSGNNSSGFHSIDIDHLRAWASKRAVDLILAATNPDALNRPDIEWQTLVFRMPDDGSGGLPVLRNIIVNDDKSATYKLGLLRALVRAADGSPGLVLDASEESVTLPFGLVALNWLKLYLPLVTRHELRQTTRGNPGFAGDAFRRLGEMGHDTLYYLRPGMLLRADLSPLVIAALNQITRSISTMPARYTTWPGTSDPVFICTRKTVRASGTVTMNRDFLAAFGEFHVPRTLWRTMSHHACWLEPAINQEWISLMKSWAGTYESQRVAWDSTLIWEDARRDTGHVRKIMDKLLATGTQQPCVWTDRSLTAAGYDIDHCLPWSRWQNNDLWNLMPASRQANNSKREKLPSSDLLLNAKGRILTWWERAYRDKLLSEQFRNEASASLALKESADLDDIFSALLIQRTRLKVNQQIQEWKG